MMASEAAISYCNIFEADLKDTDEAAIYIYTGGVSVNRRMVVV